MLTFCTYHATARQGIPKTKKYRLALPDQWMGKRSTLDHLIAIAPSVFSKIADKQFCLKCKTPYTLMFFYDSLVVESRVAEANGSSTEYRWGRPQQISNYNCITTYRFRGTWVLLYKDSAIAELEVVAPSEKITAIKKFSLNNNVLIPSSLKNRNLMLRAVTVDDPGQFVNNNPEAFDPMADDLLDVILERIRRVKP